VQVDVEDDTQRPPQLVLQLPQTGRVVVETVLVEEVLAVEAPSLDEHRRVDDATQPGWVSIRPGELKVMPGVALVYSGDGDRRSSVTAEQFGQLVPVEVVIGWGDPEAAWGVGRERRR
jgi:hypothetical protein